jgi:hypothetical protein
MGQITGLETLVFNLNQMPGNYPKEENLNTVNHGESFKFNKNILYSGFSKLNYRRLKARETK